MRGTPEILNEVNDVCEALDIDEYELARRVVKENRKMLSRAAKRYIEWKWEVEFSKYV